MKEARIEQLPRERLESIENAKEWHALLRFIGPALSFGDEGRIHLQEFGMEDIDWHARKRPSTEASDGWGVGHIMSEVSASKKKSTGYIVCSGIAGLGFNPKLGKNVSFLTHQLPASPQDKRFVDELRTVLREFAKQTDPEKRSLLIFIEQARLLREQYVEPIKTIIMEELSQKPDVAQIERTATYVPFDVKLDTEHGRIFIVFN